MIEQGACDSGCHKFLVFPGEGENYYRVTAWKQDEDHNAVIYEQHNGMEWSAVTSVEDLRVMISILVTQILGMMSEESILQ
jgi:hypothetical protein